MSRPEICSDTLKSLAHRPSRPQVSQSFGDFAMQCVIELVLFAIERIERCFYPMVEGLEVPTSDECLGTLGIIT